MTISVVGSAVSRDPRVTGLSGGTVADGDHVFWFVFYPNTMTETFASPTGWTQLRKTVGTLGTIELWWRRWHTGDPTSWTVNVTGWGSPDVDSGVTVVYRDLISDPTIVSATHETATSPAIADAITDPAIGNNDLGLYCFAAKGSALSSTTPALSESFVLGAAPGIIVGTLQTGTTGFSQSVTAAIAGGTPNDLFGLQVILPDVPSVVGGWGVGAVRMGAN